MNRRKFLTGLGAALVTIQLVTRVGQSKFIDFESMEGDFDVGALDFKVTERYSAGFTDWRAYYGSHGDSHQNTARGQLDLYS